MEEKGMGVFSESATIKGKMIFTKAKSHSIIAMNLETTEDVEKVIRQCEQIIAEIEADKQV